MCFKIRSTWVVILLHHTYRFCYRFYTMVHMQNLNVWSLSPTMLFTASYYKKLLISLIRFTMLQNPGVKITRSLLFIPYAATYISHFWFCLSFQLNFYYFDIGEDFVLRRYWSILDGKDQFVSQLRSVCSVWKAYTGHTRFQSTCTVFKM